MKFLFNRGRVAIARVPPKKSYQNLLLIHSKLNIWSFYEERVMLECCALKGATEDSSCEFGGESIPLSSLLLGRNFQINWRV